MPKKKTKASDELIIYGEPLSSLPETGDIGVWYFFNGEYWFYTGSQWLSGGGDRPTKPPVIP